MISFYVTWWSVQVLEPQMTRTICFSKPKNYIRNIFTNVLKGHIAVATADLNRFYNGKLIDPLPENILIKLVWITNMALGMVGFFNV